MTQTDKAAEAKPEVELRVTRGSVDQEFWLHMRLPDGKSAGINLGDPNGMITSAALRACVGHTFFARHQAAKPVAYLTQHKLGPMHFCEADYQPASDEWSAPFSVYTHPQDAESLRAEVERLTFALEAMENRAEVAEYKQRQAVQEVQPMIIARAEKAEAEVERLTAALDATITARDMMGNLWAKAQTDLATSRAETAMVFEVAAQEHGDDCPDDVLIEDGERVWWHWDNESAPADAVRYIRAKTPADATAALAARDKAMRFKGRNAALREALSKFYPQDRTVYETKEAREKADAEFQASALRTYIGTTDVLTATTWAGKQYLSIINGAKDRILSLIQEENQ